MKKKILTLLVLLMTAVTGAWAQGSDPDPIELTSTDGKTWTLASMPDYDVELEVEYETELALSETTDNSAALTEWNGYEADVTLTRTLATGSWNTLAVPFSISEANYTALQTMLTAQGGSIKVKELTGSSLVNGKLTLNFTDATQIEAGKPYLVKVSKELNLATLPAAIDDLAAVNPALTNPFKGVIISNAVVPVTTDAVIFVPTLGKTLVTGPAGDESNAAAVLFLAAGNTLVNPTVVNDATAANNASYLKGFRGYFQVKDASAVRAFSLNLGEETGINEELRMKNEEFATAPVYDLQGRRVDNAEANSSLFTLHSSLKKGVYIMNGKKVIIK